MTGQNCPRPFSTPEASWAHTSMRQRGLAMIIFIFLTSLATASIMLLAVSMNNIRHEKDKKTQQALAEAKAALVGYAIKDVNIPLAGNLPNPDMDFAVGAATYSEGQAVGNFTGNSRDLTLIGKFPWSTLATAPLRDGANECLWYVVSGRFKSNPSTDSFNWDTQGQIDIIDSNGKMIASNLAAMIVSVGEPLDGQTRAAPSLAHPQCGPKYSAQDYLDPDPSDSTLIFMGQVNYFPAATNQRIASNTNNKQFVLAGNSHYNDRFITVTVDDIFRPLMQRSDFATQINNLLDDKDFRTQSNTVTISGASTKGADNINCTAISDTKNAAFCTHWKEMLLLTQLPVPSPITIDGVATSACSRVVIFGGAKTATQKRVSTIGKNTPANYLEGQNLAAFATPIANSNNFDGASKFISSSPATDILRCL